MDHLSRAVDRTRLRGWLNSREGCVFREWLEARRGEMQEMVTRPNLDLSDARNVYRVAQAQGECRLIRDLLDEDGLLKGLEQLIQSKETYGP